jgi:hypothetical protein
MTRSTKATKRIDIRFEKLSLAVSPLRNRTVDLLLTMATLTRPESTSCTDGAPERPESTECTQCSLHPVHDSFHGRTGRSLRWDDSQ